MKRVLYRSDFTPTVSGIRDNSTPAGGKPSVGCSMECQHDQRNRVPNMTVRRQSCRPSKLAVAPRSVACGSLNRLLVTTRSNRSNEVADANGKIIGRCVEWTEARPGWEALLKTIGGLLMVATCMLIIPALIARNGRAPSILPLCTLGVAMLSLCVFEIAGRVPGQTHWVVFRNDGGIESSEDEAWPASIVARAIEQTPLRWSGSSPYGSTSAKNRRRHCASTQRRREPTDDSRTPSTSSQADPSWSSAQGLPHECPCSSPLTGRCSA